ncbi:MAG: 4-(cytidine 5'-diphospho)-2-C-methyl-D-erythritol kinase [Lachnospiraceae bacterium]|nr:4-(cytidine 5'-diphospho)-2-C-methyl-D-erythritol kinase [Lachnospiraceae bacterium]
MQKDTLEIKAYAKINLGLDVLRRRPDGYHEVRMIMQTVGIYDTLVLKKAERGIAFHVIMAGEGESPSADAGEVPNNEDNLGYKAAKLLMETYGIEEGVNISLTKRIPVAAGMAGGSTDAAAVLKGMNLLFELGLSEETLQELGVKLGADVPYCIQGGTALAEGIGERLTGLSDAPDCVLLVAKPDISVSTKYVYENLKPDALERRPDIDGMMAAIGEGSLDGILDCMENVLQSVTEVKYPVIGKLKQQMEAEGAVKAMMSGSGPTVFGIFKEEEKARAAYEAVLRGKLAKQVFLTGFINPSKEEG